MRRSVQRLLNVHHYATELFASAEAFLDRPSSSRAACIVLDIHLEGMSGLELRSRLTASGCNLPVIFITAIDDQAVELAATLSGCVAYLRKPFPAELLIAAVERALADAPSD